MRALITGAAGLCGKHLADYLREMGGVVHTLSQRDYMTPLHYHLKDVTNVEAITSVLNTVRPEYVFHLAGITYSDDPLLFYRMNTQYAVALLYAMEASGLDSSPVLLVGTSAEYGDITHEQLPIHEGIPARPYNHYGISKLAQTFEGLSMHRKGRPIVVVRPFNVIGTGMHDNLVVQSFATQVVKIKRGQIEPVIRVGNLDSTRDFIDVEDVVRIYWKLVNSPSAYGEIFNVCSGTGTSVRDILSKLISLSGINAKIEIDPGRFRPIDVPQHFGSTEKLERITGEIPNTNLEMSLRRILEWLENQL